MSISTRVTPCCLVCAFANDTFEPLFSHGREMTALALSVLRGIVENGLEMEKVYVYLPQANSAFSNIFASILLARLFRASG